MLDDLFFGRKILPGEEVILSGGYDSKRKWGEEEKLALVIKFFPGQGHNPALLIEFRDPLSFVGFDAKYAILELRFENAQWRDGAVCFVEVFSHLPEEKPWNERQHGPFVESRAVVKKL